MVRSPERKSPEYGVAGPAFLCKQDGNFRGESHDDDVCVIARGKQFQAFGTMLEERCTMNVQEDEMT